MEIDQLRYFLKVAEIGHFTRAAEAAGVSQSALSRSILKLEQELGQPVFERKTRSVELTDAGTLLQSRATQIIAIIDDTKAEICDDGQSGRIRIGAIPTIAPFFLPDLLRNFADQFPNASLLVQEQTTDDLLKACTQGEVDIALLALPLSVKYLEIEELFEEELLLVMPPDHALSNKKQIHLRDIESLPFVMLNEAHCLSENITTFCRQRSVQPLTVEQTSQLATVQELVSLDHGVSMIPQMARAVDSTDRRVYRSFSKPKPTRKIAAVWNPYRFQSQLVQHFQKFLRQSIKA